MPGRSRTWCFTTNPHGWGNMRSHGRKHVFVVCGNPDCPTTPNWTSAVFPTTSPSATYSHACSARSAIIAAPTLPARGCITPDRAARPFEYRNHPRLQGLDASAFHASAFVVNRVSFAPGVVVDLAGSLESAVLHSLKWEAISASARCSHFCASIKYFQLWMGSNTAN
jgi:hypothetical protein